MAQATIVCVGETLWDILPAGEFIGGAPFNVAAHASRLGARARLISRVGKDARGESALRMAARHGIDQSLLQTDARLPTGIARITLAADGSAAYELPAPAAWDALETTAAGLHAAAKATAVVYGTLGQRDVRAREAVRALVAAAHYRIYDPNLRAPHFDREISLSSLEHADLVKFNEHECSLFARWIGCGADADRLHAALRHDFGVRSLCITRGVRGALLFHGGRRQDQAAVPAAVADTIGAGDAFLAMLSIQLLDDADPAVALLRAVRLASFVASKPGAVPRYSPDSFLA